MFMKGDPQPRYEIIAETIKQDNNLLNISYLCQLAGVSRSGFLLLAVECKSSSKVRRTRS